MERYLMKTEPLMPRVWFTKHRKNHTGNTVPELAIFSKFSVWILLGEPITETFRTLIILPLKDRLGSIFKMEPAIAFLVENDAVFSSLYQKYGQPFTPSRPEGFQTLCKLILEQQVSIESARACYLKIENALGEVSPKSIMTASEEILRSCGVSRQKSKYLKALAEAILDKSLVLEALSNQHPDEVRKALINIKGIGHWTIDVYLMFALQSPDVLPIGDIAVVNTIKELYGLEQKEEMIALAENWKPYRTTATYFLWHHYLVKRNRKFIF